MTMAPTAGAALRSAGVSATGKPTTLGSATVTASKAAPGLTPSTALSVGSAGGDIVGNARAVSHAHNQVSIARAAETADASHPGGLAGFFSEVGHYVGDVQRAVGEATAKVPYLNDALNALSAPLHVVQHEYRYLHDVESRHGMGAMLGEALGMAAGAGLGFVVGGPSAAVLGAEGAAYLEGRLLYKNSWARTTTGARYHTPKTGDVISIGRTVANALGFHGSAAYSTISGTIDAMSDLALTPLGQAGKLVGQARSAEGAKAAANRIFGGLGITSPDDVTRAFRQYKGFRNAVRSLSDMDAGDVVARHPRLAGIAKELGQAQSPDDVIDVFREVAKANELRTTDTLPTQSFVSDTFAKLKAAAANTQDVLGGDNRLARFATTNFLLGPARWSRRLTRVPGGNIDPVTHALESQIDPRTGMGAKTIFHMVRYSQSDRTARMVANSYVYALPADRVTIFRNAIMDTVAKMAHVDQLGDEFDSLANEDIWSEITTAEVRKALKRRLDTLTGGAFPGSTGGLYGADAEGREMPVYDPEHDRTFGAALYESQAGKMGMPSFTEVKRMAKMLKGGNAFIGRADDYLYHYVTQGFFKPLALLTPAYALHMAMAEDIPNALRLGPMRFAEAKFHSVYAKLGYAASEEGEGLNLFRAWLLTVLDHVPRSEAKVDAYAKMVATLEGNPTTLAVSAAGDTSKMASVADNASKMLRDIAKKGLVTSDKKFVQYENDSPYYVQEWRKAIREAGRNETARRAAARYVDEMRAGAHVNTAVRNAGREVADYLKHEMDPDERDLYVRSRYYTMEHPPAGWTPLDDWGDSVATAVHGLLGRDDNLDLATDIALGRTPSQRDLEAIDPQDRPLTIKGRAMVEPEGATFIQKIVEPGFRHVVNPMINRMSREPMFAEEFYKAYKPLVPQVEAGQLDDDEAVGLALDRASNKSLRFIHNVRTRSQWSETVRNWFPFAFAQEQAYKRAGRLLAEDPGAFRRYQLMITKVHTWLAAQQDKTGNKWFSIPGAGILGKGVPRLMEMAGVPLVGVTAGSFGGNFSSANVIFPLSTGFRPDLSPLATFAAKGLYNIFPELLPAKTAATMREAITQAAGTMTTQSPVWEMAMPWTIGQRAIITGLATHDRGFATTMVNVMNTLDYLQGEAVMRWVKDGRKGPAPDIVPPPNADPHTMQQFVDKVRNETRILYAVRAAVGAVSPVSPEVVIQTFGVKTELQKEAKKQGSWTKGVTVYLQRHPEAWPYTLGDSTTMSGGFVQESQQAENWLTDNLALVNKYPNGAVWLMPQPKTTVFSQSVYNTQLAQHLRAKTSPQQYLDKLYVTAGDQLYYAMEKRFYTTEVAGLHGKAKDLLYTERTMWLRQMERANPIWGASYLGHQRTILAQHSIFELETMQQKGLFPNNEQAKKVAGLLSSYREYETAYVAAGRSYNYAHEQSVVKQDWFNYLQGVKKADPTLVPVVTTVFEHAIAMTTGTTAP